MDITNMDVEKVYNRVKFMDNIRYMTFFTGKVMAVASGAILSYTGAAIAVHAAQLAGQPTLLNEAAIGLALISVMASSISIPFQLAKDSFRYAKESKSVTSLNEVMKKISEYNGDPGNFIGELQKIGVTYTQQQGWGFPEELNKKRNDELKTKFIQTYENKREIFETQRVSHEIHALMVTLTGPNPPMNRILVDMAKVGIEPNAVGWKITSSKPEIRDLQNELLQKYDQVKTRIAKQEVKIIEKAYAVKVALSNYEKDPGDQLSAMQELGIRRNPVTGWNIKLQDSPTITELLRNLTRNYDDARNHYTQAVPNTRADPGMQIRLKTP